jgi:hypothetical protein
MKVKKYNITLPKKYLQNNMEKKKLEEKTFWANVGTMTEFYKDDGSVGRIMELNHTSEKFSIFEIEPKEQGSQGYQNPRGQGQAPQQAVQTPEEDINPEDIPF